MARNASKPLAIVGVIGMTQTINWAASYYLPAVLAPPMAAAIGVSPVLVFAAFSMALIVSALVGPLAGSLIDRVGGRRVLMASNLVLACGLATLASATTASMMFLGWAIIGAGMGMGLYEAAFTTVAAIYGDKARGALTGITLLAGFASTLGWPLTSYILSGWGWRQACIAWALILVGIALPLNSLIPEKLAPATLTIPAQQYPPAVSRRNSGLLAFVFAATWFNSTAMAAHLPALLQIVGVGATTSIAAAALIGPSQVAARLLDLGLLRRLHPVVSAKVAAFAHPLGAVALAMVGSPAAVPFAILHGAGNGMLTIAQGTLPLVLFGPTGYGLRLGWLNAPARLVQAAAPLVFGATLATFGASAIWMTAVVGLMAMVALCRLQVPKAM